MGDFSFSFIIPHKNLSLDLLNKCLNSIPSREDVEIIVVDDDSDANIVDFTLLQKLNDDIIKVIFDKSGKGPGNARNIGIREAKGKWLLFADADDYYDKGNLELFMNNILDSDADVVYMGVKVIDLSGESNVDVYNAEQGEASLIDVSDRDAYLCDQHQSWRRALKSDFVKEQNLIYPEIRYCEDQSVSVNALIKAKKIQVFPNPVYCYIHRNNSITKQLSFKDMYDGLFDAFRTNNFIRGNNFNTRLKVTSYILSLLRKKNIFLLYFFVLCEFIRVDSITAKSDYKNACRMSYIDTNPIKVFADWVRVNLGSLRQKFS